MERELKVLVLTVVFKKLFFVAALKLIWLD